ncbi:hypothetical protein ACI2U9_17655 [Ralstonia nicotianae]
MKEKIRRILESSQPLKGREIARLLGVPNRDVNRILHDCKQDFLQDDASYWRLSRPAELRVQFPKAQWLSTRQFENALSQVESPLDSACSKVIFEFAPSTSVLLDAIARLLALCNQLIYAGKSVTIDFSGCKETSKYLNRVGFYDLLDQKVDVLPNRPKRSTAKELHGGNSGLVEVAKIDLQHRDKETPRRLQVSLAEHVAFPEARLHTILAELFSNIHEHSSSPIPGFVALQLYRKGSTPHISTVFSDSGTGIAGSLLPTLDAITLAKLDASGKDRAVALVELVFTDGQLSRLDDDGRGLGLFRTGECTQRFKGSISVRQDTFEVTIRYTSDERRITSRTGLRRMNGTHICVKFNLTQ